MMNARQVNSGKNRALVKLEGDINEWMDYSQMIPAEANRVDVLCDGVGQVNSIGLRSWLGMLAERTSAGVTFRFHWVSLPVAALLRLFAPTLAFTSVMSVQVQLRCGGCGRTRQGLIQTAGGVREIARVQSAKCRCGGNELLDEGRDELEALKDLLRRA